VSFLKTGSEQCPGSGAGVAVERMGEDGVVDGVKVGDRFARGDVG